MVGWSPLPDAAKGAGKFWVKIIRFLRSCQGGKPFWGCWDREKGEGRREKGEGRREKGEGRREKGQGANGGGAVCVILPKISGRIL
jgi:hypothetical protein